MSDYSNHIDEWPRVTGDAIMEIPEIETVDLQKRPRLCCFLCSKPKEPHWTEHELSGKQRVLDRRGALRHWQLIYQCLACGAQRVFGTVAS